MSILISHITFFSFHSFFFTFNHFTYQPQVFLPPILSPHLAPTPLQSTPQKGLGLPLGIQQILAYQIEAGASPYPCWTRSPTIWTVLQKVRSCTRNRSYFLCQGFHKPSHTAVTHIQKTYFSLMQDPHLSVQSSWTPRSWDQLSLWVSPSWSSLHPSVVHIIPPSSLKFDSTSSAWILAVDLCTHVHQLLDEGSMTTIRVLTNLIIGEDWFRHCC